MEMGDRIKWTDQRIKADLMKMGNEEGLSRMPTRKEVERFYGDGRLSNAITKHIGWYNLADALGLSIKNSETTFGKKYEKLVQERLISMGYEARRMPQNFPYDLLVNDSVKIDVKASRLYMGTVGNFYSFNLEKPFCTCDLYVLCLIGVDEAISSYLIVPSKDVPTNTQISVGESKSKYNRYKDKWDYIEEYNRFFSSVS